MNIICCIFGVFLFFPLVAGAMASGSTIEWHASQGILAKVTMGGLLFLLFFLLFRDKAHQAHRTQVALFVLSIILLISALTPLQLLNVYDMSELSKHVSWTVFWLLLGMMGIIGVLNTTNVFRCLVVYSVKRVNGHPILLSKVIWHLTGFLSAWLDNVTTVLLMKPIAGHVSALLGLSVWVFYLPIIMFSNIGGTATLIGDPPNIIIGSATHLTFIDFLWSLTIPVILMMMLIEKVTLWYYRVEYASAKPLTEIPAERLQNKGLMVWSLGILGLVLVGFMTHHITGFDVAVIAMTGVSIILLLQHFYYLRSRKYGKTKEDRETAFAKVFHSEIEWSTLFFFVFLFMIVGAAVETGLIKSIADGMNVVIFAFRDTFGLSEAGTLFVAMVIILITSAVASAFVDNIPFTILAIPIVAYLDTQIGTGENILWWSLALGACLGGNGTPIGASANVTLLGLAEKDGHQLFTADFCRFSIPVTALTLFVAFLYLTGYIYLGHTAINLIFLAIILGWLSVNKICSVHVNRLAKNKRRVRE